MTECLICCETTKLIVQCSYCDHEVCRRCARRYILESSQEAHCMNCKKVWDAKFLIKNFTKQWVVGLKEGQYRCHIKNVAIEKEKAKIPETMLEIPRIKQQEYEKSIIRHYKQEIDNLRQQINALNMEIRKIKYGHVHNTNNQPKKITFICPCPYEDCRGMIQSNTFKCCVYEKKVCKSCREPKQLVDEKGEQGKDKYLPHTCDPGILENIKSIRDETKPCPKCASPIFKISGCFEPNTPVMLYNTQIVKAKDIKVGMELMGDDGTPRVVEQIKEGYDDLYKIIQNKADDYIVNSKHKLVLKSSKNGKKTYYNEKWVVEWFENGHRKKSFLTEIEADEFLESKTIQDPIEILIEDFINLPKTTKETLYGYRSNGFDINNDDSNLLIDPYILGIWLGDGYSDGTSFAVNDIEILTKLVSWFKTINCEITHESKYRYSVRRAGYGYKKVVGQGNCCNFCNQIKPVEGQYVKTKTNQWKDLLKKYNLINNKHIPECYLFSSTTTRKNILAGLIDTDGHVSNMGTRITISQASGILSKQIVLVARSLGLYTHFQTRKQYKSIFGQEKKHYKDLDIINISGFVNDIPTLVTRKKCNNSSPNKNNYFTSIKIEHIGRGKYYGWCVSGPNKRFVLSDFTVVRNCDQMWCTECQTAFSWRTGNIETGVIHNPHAIRWYREHGQMERDINDVPCGGLVQLHQINMRNFNYDDVQKIRRIHRFIAELNYTVNRIQTEEDYSKYRLDYVLNKITEQQWKQRVFEHSRHIARNKTKQEITITLRTLATEQFRMLAHEQGNASQRSLQFLTTMEDIRKFINETYINELSILGSTRPPQIENDWRWKSYAKKK